MVPFKPYLLGQETPPYLRATSVQKCVRTLDIEEVGKTTRHGTFFQMNGNFSFGDYFKEGAIELAWELVTGSQADGGFGFDPATVWVTVLDDDDEAARLWRKVAGLPDERIQRRGLADNYWHMGVPGPGGPCSEIYIDRGPEYGPDGGPVVDEDRFLEFWNLVFMQEEPQRGPQQGRLRRRRPAAAAEHRHRHGPRAGRLPAAGRRQPLRDRRGLPGPRARRRAGRQALRRSDPTTDDVRLRVVADHVRSALMLISDGVTPGNEARGYVLRRLLRRAVRSMRLLGVDEPVLPELLAGQPGRDGAVVPRAGHRLRPDLVAGVRRGGGLPAAPCGPAPRSSTRRSASTKTPGRHDAVRRRAPSSCTTPTASRSTSPSRWPPSRASRSTAPASAG